jgi:hypothetical protein
MRLEQRIRAFAQLSNFMQALADENETNLQENLKEIFNETNNLIKNLKIYNPWFIEKFVRTQLKALSQITTIEKLQNWLSPYYKKIEQHIAKKVGVVMAGNIPLVGFHDFLAILITGNKIIIKTSSKDNKLPVKIAEALTIIQPKFKEQIFFTKDKLSDFEAVIATGSSNTARYFEYYFSKVPNIIRKSRNSPAILSGYETQMQLEALADDIMLYFGLGCRNVSKLFVPENYNFDNLFKALFKYKDLIYENKYANNYDYNRAIFLLNGDKFLDNGFVIIKENQAIASPIAVIHYETYKNIEDVKEILNYDKEKIQCIVTDHQDITEANTVNFGKSQFPQLDDYEDNINTIEFLLEI